MRRILATLAAILVLACASDAAAANPRVKVETTMGNFIIELYPDKAPKTVRNFVVYVRSNFYNGTLFHRIIPGFVVQGGGFDASMTQKTTRAPIMNEADNRLRNSRFTLSMARTNDPHSATSQFFINLTDNDMLDHRNTTPQGWGYAVFGKVIEGQRVIDDISTVRTGRLGMHADVPLTPIVVKKMTMLP